MRQKTNVQNPKETADTTVTIHGHIMSVVGVTNSLGRYKMNHTKIASTLADDIADWFGLYGKCGECICNDDGETADTTEMVQQYRCRRCFTDMLFKSLMEQLTPQIDTAFCPTCGRVNV